MSENAAKAKPTEFVIHIDGVQYKVTVSSMTGAQLKALANKDPQYQLFEEQKGSDADKEIPNDTSVHIQNGLHFYTMPPATFGA